MNDKLQKLQDIGAQKIHEDTHIPIEHVQALIHESFEGFSKLQFIGFVSILEREYKEDLSELKQNGLTYYGNNEPVKKKGSLFVLPKRAKNYTPIYITILFAVFLLGAFITFNISNKSDEMQTDFVENPIIEDAKKTITLEQEEFNETNSSELAMEVDINESAETDNNLTVLKDEVEEVVTEASLTIKTNTKVWLGYIDTESDKHYTKTFKGEFELDPSKNWLLVFGHGFIDIYVNGELEEFKAHNNLRFVYKDGKLSAVTLEEFKKLNKGRKW